MSDLDLQKFCSVDPCRYYLTRPFSFGEFSYASNGHVMIRIPRRSEIPEQEKKEVNWNAPLACHEGAQFSPPLDIKLPPLSDDAEPCVNCFDGRVHNCPDCECVCEDCNGTGNDIPERRTSTTLNGSLTALRYVRLILSLPGIVIGKSAGEGLPIPFQFDGGIGALMPLSRKYPTHIEVSAAKGEAT